jgi:adenine-specific DNA-methyltransferase
MDNKNQKLELTWIGKGDEIKLEPRILVEQPEYSYGDPYSGNILIQGDNLLALKALEQEYAGKIKCIYIDPPYNTGNAFEHYDDGLEHSIWLNLMKPRLALLRKLLADDGSIWISIDDHECHYLKVACDEVFGRSNFLNSIIWQKKHTRSNDARWLSDNHDFVLAYTKNKALWKRNLLPRTKGTDDGYSNVDKDPRGPWASGPCHAKTLNENAVFQITTPSGRVLLPPPGTSWRFSKQRFEELIKDNRIYFGTSGNNVPRYKRFITEVQDGLVPLTIWTKDEVGDNQEAKQEVKQFNPLDVFSTPKPERLLERVFQISTNINDLVLDSFLGSGTTAAVAHKMGRKWIGIELGEHAKTHCYPRLRKVVEGEQGGISKSVNWIGGGGFRFYALAPSLLNKDKYGNWIISKEYNPDMLAAAMAKQEGFKYEPNEHTYWKQGKSSEKDFIFTTTRFITVEILDNIHDEMQPGESLLIACKAFQPECEFKFSNLITLKKIPQLLIGKCEFGKDDYSFNIVNLPGEYDKVIINETITDYESIEEEIKGDDFPTNLFDQ